MFENSKLKKEAKERAKSRSFWEGVVSDHLGREAEAKSWLRNPDVTYWSLNYTTVNHHAPIEGPVYDLSDDELRSLGTDYIFHDHLPLEKKEAKQIKKDLLEIVQSQNMSLQDLIQYVVNEAPETYRVVLFRNFNDFKKALKRQGTWTDTDVMTTRKERKSALDDLYAVICKMNILNDADIIQFVLHERPAEYLTFIFENSKDVDKLMEKWSTKKIQASMQK